MFTSKSSPRTIQKYPMMAILALSFILFLNQKPNFTLTITGIALTLISVYLYLRLREKSYHEEAHTAKTDYNEIEGRSAFAKFDKNFNLTYASQEFIEMLGIEEGNLLTILKNCSLEASNINKMKKSIKHQHIFSEVLQLEIAHKIYHIDTFIHKISNKNFTQTEYIIRCNDISAYINTKNELRNQLYIDRFTKLPTRLQLCHDMEIKANAPIVYAQTLIYLEVDNYEEKNEYFGIDIGYKLLLEIAKWLQENLPTKTTKLYKFEHNHFAIYCSSRINLLELEDYIKNLHAKAHNTQFLIGETYHDISFTMGISRGKRNLLRHAYLALKEAQKNNKPYKIYNKKNAQEEKYLQNLQTSKEIKSALLEDRVVPFFQPILNIKNNKIEKFESLIRIQNTDNTHLNPADFLDIAKQSRLYPELTKAMISSSLKRLEYLKHPITINISISDILNSKVSSFILRKLNRHPFAELVTFEILETDEISNYTRIGNFIKKVKSLGCHIAIDDFGSGYSNFEQVLKLDIDYIKIDGSLIKNILSNKESEIITKTIIGFAKELDIKTIAEFVTTKEVFDKVKLLGVDYAQGYYIGKPSPMPATLNR